MTTWYSTAFTADGINQSAPDPVHVAPGSDEGGKVAYKRAYVDISGIGTLLNSSEVRLFPIRSGDRPIALYLSTDGNFFANWTLDLGLWDKGVNHGGIELRRNMFVNKEPVDVPVVREERLAAAAGSVVDADRGLTAWEMVNILGTVGGKTYGRDPHEEWDLSGFLINLVAPGVGGTLIAELYYIPAHG